MTTKYTPSEQLVSAVKTFFTLFVSAILLNTQAMASFDWEALKTILIISGATALRAVLNQFIPSK